MNTRSLWAIFLPVVALLVLVMCRSTVEGRALDIKQKSAPGQVNVYEADEVVSGVVTLLAGFKQPSKLATCGMRTAYHKEEIWSKTNTIIARVVAGEQSSNRWPWQVALVNTTTKEPFCGGTLIDREHIITAAHCLDGKNQNDIVVVLGEHDRSKPEGTEQRFPVDCVHIHRRYVKDVPYNNDIAVVKLKTAPGKDVVINDFVMPACLPEKNEFKAGDRCYVTGWGYTNFFDLLVGKRPQVLNEAQVPILSNDECRQAYGSSISKKMVCAGYLEGDRRADTCKGDSGGPLICQQGEVWKLFGVTSWGDNTFCNPSPTDAVPGVYTRVDRYRSWIQSRIEMDRCPSRR